MAGWRIGFVSGAHQLMNQLLRFKSNMDSGMYLPLQKGAIAALQLPDSWHNDLNKIYRQRRDIVFKILDSLQCTYNKDQAGMFVWAKRPEFVSDTEKWIDHLLYSLGIFITPGQVFGRNERNL